MQVTAPPVPSEALPQASRQTPAGKLPRSMRPIAE